MVHRRGADRELNSDSEGFLKYDCEESRKKCIICFDRASSKFDWERIHKHVDFPDG